MNPLPLPEKIRAAILAGDKNHDYGQMGFARTAGPTGQTGSRTTFALRR